MTSIEYFSGSGWNGASIRTRPSLNSFLSPLTEIILKHHGTIDKSIGDCIAAFWNAPIDDPHHARNACLAVLEMHAREFEQAAASFQEVLAIFPKDGPSSLYFNAATDYGALPPPESWDGVFHLTGT